MYHIHKYTDTSYSSSTLDTKNSSSLDSELHLYCCCISAVLGVCRRSRALESIYICNVHIYIAAAGGGGLMCCATCHTQQHTRRQQTMAWHDNKVSITAASCHAAANVCCTHSLLLRSSGAKNYQRVTKVHPTRCYIQQERGRVHRTLRIKTPHGPSSQLQLLCICHHKVLLPSPEITCVLSGLHVRMII